MPKRTEGVIVSLLPPPLKFCVSSANLFTIRQPANRLLAGIDYSRIQSCTLFVAQRELKALERSRPLRCMELQGPQKKSLGCTTRRQSLKSRRTSRCSGGLLTLRPICFFSSRQCLRGSLACVAAQMPWPRMPMQRNTAGNFIIAGSRFPRFYSSGLSYELDT